MTERIAPACQLSERLIDYANHIITYCGDRVSENVRGNHP